MDYEQDAREGGARGKGGGRRRRGGARRSSGSPRDATPGSEPGFSPRAVLDQVFARARELGHGSTDLVGNIGATVRDNPIPILLLSAGVASLIASERMRKGASRRGTRGRLEDWDDDDDAGQERIAALTSRARSAGAQLSESMRGTMSRVRDGGARTLEDQPLLVAGIGLAVGAALGAALPLSERERRTLGPARERLLERAREVAREGADRVREGAERVREGAERVRGLAERAGGGTRTTAGQAARRRETEDAESDEPIES